MATLRGDNGCRVSPRDFLSSQPFSETHDTFSLHAGGFPRDVVELTPAQVKQLGEISDVLLAHLKSG